MRSDARAHLRAVQALLTDAGVPSPEADARALLAFALGSASLPYPLPERLDDAQVARLADAVDRRSRREPLQHIVGETGFRTLTLQVRPGVFVPRPETEAVAEVAVLAAAAVRDQGRVPLVVELCCGAGGIAVSVGVEVPGATVVAVDLSPLAVDLTRCNADAAGLAALRVQVGDVRDPDLLTELAGSVDVVAANPPYIPPDQVPVEPEVRDHDPDLALYGGGADGLDVPRAVVLRAATLLAPGGVFVMEHAEVQAGAVRRLVEADGRFVEVGTRQDLAGRDRMVVARRGATSPVDSLA